MDDFTHGAGDPLAGVLQGDCFGLHRIHPKSLVSVFSTWQVVQDLCSYM